MYIAHILTVIGFLIHFSFRAFLPLRLKCTIWPQDGSETHTTHLKVVPKVPNSSLLSVHPCRTTQQASHIDELMTEKIDAVFWVVCVITYMYFYERVNTHSHTHTQNCVCDLIKKPQVSRRNCRFLWLNNIKLAPLGKTAPEKKIRFP